MNINNFLKKDLFLVDKSYSTKEDALKDFAKILEKKGYAKNADKVLEKAIERENQFSTGIGSKIAIPHIRDDVMNKSVILFAKVKPMDWKSLDNQNVEVIFFIAMNISEGENSHLEVISNLSSLFMDEKFINKLLSVNKFNELIDLLNNNLNSENKDVTKTEDNSLEDNDSYDIVAVTACPTGIAHTFMAAKKLEDVAKEMGVKIKVETQGTEGPRNVLKQEEIDNAKGVILACDKIVDTSRFVGHNNVLEISTKSAIKDAKKEINRSLNKKGVKIKGSKSNKSNFEESDNLISFDKFGKRLYKSLMTGVSYMLPFVIFGGILIALAFLIDIKHASGNNAGQLGSIEPAAKWFKGLGDISFGLMTPILGAYIAYALVGKMGLLPGFVCSQIAAGAYLFKLNPQNGTVEWLSPSSGGSLSGVFGAIIGGIYSGIILIALIKYVFNYLPQQLNGIKNILFIPLFGTLLIAASFWIINIPLIYINYGFTKLLELIEKANVSPILGLLIGTMMAVDLGGPINKAAYVVATLTLKEQQSASANGTIAMACAMAGGMTPPLGIALSCTFFKKMWTKEQRVAGYSNYIMGLSFISEGAIPFTTENPKLLVPANIASGCVAGLLSAAFGIKLNAPHGGIFVFPLVSTDFYGTIENPGVKIGAGIALYLAAIIIGALTSMLLLYILYKVYKKSEGKASKQKKSKFILNKNKNKLETATK